MTSIGRSEFLGKRTKFWKITNFSLAEVFPGRTLPLLTFSYKTFPKSV